MTLVEALRWLMSPAGAGWLAYWIVGRIDTSRLEPWAVRVIAVGISATIAIAADLVLIFAAKVGVSPDSAWGWAEELFAVAAGSFLTSTMIQAKDLPTRAQMGWAKE